LSSQIYGLFVVDAINPWEIDTRLMNGTPRVGRKEPRLAAALGVSGDANGGDDACFACVANHACFAGAAGKCAENDAIHPLVLALVQALAGEAVQAAPEEVAGVAGAVQEVAGVARAQLR
jgi:hypothetical protein